ncbi:MAG: ATP-binding protein [Candidatus Heimdallarchaeota archaeon]|nr:ATP-binding protein [Candidatus Heimdallarchaeota archaeon]
MEILEASTSEISFQIQRGDAIFHEQDFILVTEGETDKEKQFIAQISKLVQTEPDKIRGNAIILGEIDFNSYNLQACRFPISIHAKLTHPPPGLISKVLSYRGEDGIYLGDVVTYENKSDSFLISPEFMERHVLCVASTGAGKSYTIGVILEELLLKTQGVAIVLFDIHNEYWGLIEPNEGPETKNLTFDSYKPRGFPENIMIFDKEVLSLGKLVDLPRLRRILDLTPAQENSLVNIIKNPIPLEDLISLIESSNIHSSTRENLILKINSLIALNLFQNGLDIKSLGKAGQISIIRLDEFIDERKRDLVVNEILNHIFEKKIHGDLPRESDIVIVVEEAHRYAKSSEILARIAREGRKFGIYEILISQRPGDLPDNIIANMNTLIALRIRSDKDISKIRMMEGISSDTVSILPHLDKGEALLVGHHGATSRPLKINIRPRLTKHVDPQKDIMPFYTPFFKNKGKSDEFSVDEIPLQPTEVEDLIINDDELFSSKLEAFTYMDLTNLLSCQHILIQHKNTGICLFDLGTTMLKIDAQLVSGFLSAISGLFSELKNKTPVKDRTIVRMFTEEIGDRAFEILTVEGSYSILAIILNRKPKYLGHFKRKVRNFIYAFEKRYKTTLKDFVGVLDDFQSTYELLDQFLGLSLQTPLVLNSEFKDVQSYPIVLNIITNLSEQLAQSEGIFLEEIVNQCLLDSEYNYREIAEILISLLEEKALILADSSRKVPPVSTREDLMFIGTSETEEIKVELNNDVVDAQNLDEIDTHEQELRIKDIFSECQVHSLSAGLKRDILTRDFIFESKVQVKTETTKTEVLSKTDLLKWIKKILEKGFVLHEVLENPLKGKKLLFRSEYGAAALSIALISDDEFIIIFGEF